MVRNLALVDQIALDFGPGLNVLTGETGAGKSVLVGALSLVLGARASADVVRTGAAEAVVEALFEALDPAVIARVNEMGWSAPDGQLVIRRVVTRGGRSRVQINGQLATVGMLSKLMRGVLDITSQHEHVSLLDPEAHLEAVDTFGRLEELRAEVAEAHAAVRAHQSALSELEIDEAAKRARLESLREGIEAIDNADPSLGEVEALESELMRLRHQGELSVGLHSAEAALYSAQGSVVEVVGQVVRTLERLAALDDALSSSLAVATSVAAELDDLSRTLAKYQGRLQADPGRLDWVEDRLQTLRSLTRRFGGDVETVLACRQSMADELAGFDEAEARLAELEARVAAERRVLDERAATLSERRRAVIRRLSDAIQSELAELSMDKTRVGVELRPLDAPAAHGRESAELMMSPNPGEPLRPLRRIASGGEMSRLLLAIKNVLAHRSVGATYVFDEIDTGIGGAVAEAIGAKLRSVAGTSQVIAVTHLPQVAAFADVHFQVEKAVRGSRTATVVRRLSAGQQVTELARMLGGFEITTATRSLAKEMRTRAVRAPGIHRSRRAIAH